MEVEQNSNFQHLGTFWYYLWDSFRNVYSFQPDVFEWKCALKDLKFANVLLNLIQVKCDKL